LVDKVLNVFSLYNGKVYAPRECVFKEELNKEYLISAGGVSERNAVILQLLSRYRHLVAFADHE
jgi:hypothetical protein